MGLNLSLIGVGIAGVLMVWVLMSKRFAWNWNRYAGMERKAMIKAVPFWLQLVTLLSFGLIVFAIHALLFVHGIVK